ncbi:MAG: DNA primase [Candidatus Zambryskibacteria bacterium RIFOXYC1_FULL_39_10]|uniref:DNA primase n=1 Tax=Candidatus Zambryskibacteria bacterium RIFOXYC1_FULL_39_10 TaxID=1802779 RepID=A0A1G2V2E0_9BACT|nr:MAG: DNA primase [Candidatus Zambryskibacteria bacterium RIFOXYD1_FULL_39_35]OHB15788.1 MAG: DNA primase [Candidatus Zambryskibacteria bacterium RIFOXYC1_FULL_39_10]
MSSNTEQIKEKLDIVDVISSYIKVEKAGINFKARCPFHNEKTPSFLISPVRQTFYCFGCGEKGDIFSFVEKFEGLDFKGALETLANKAGIELKNFKKEDNERPDEKDKMFAIMEAATKFFENQLENSKPNLNYLEKRGVLTNSVSKWRLGFARDEWRGLCDELTKQGFSKDEMLKVGLIKKVDGEEKYYDTFRNRIMFPIFDVADRVIAFSGRALKEDDKTPKYLNSPETKLFYKSEVLYGFNVAKNYIRKLDYTVLVEGQMDLIMSHQAGITNTVASSGTALTSLHLKKIQKLSNRVIIAYDSDSAGEKASRRAAELALSSGMEVKIVTLPKGEDPASIAKEDPEKWKTALKESKHFTEHALDKAVAENKSKNLAKAIMTEVLPLVHLISSEMEKTQFVKKIALKTKVREDDVWNDIKKVPLPNTTETIKQTTDSLPEKINLERIIVGLIFAEEHSKEKSALREEWQKIIGEQEVNSKLANFEGNKEALIFEAEMHIAPGDIRKIEDEILRRIELEYLKIELQKLATILDSQEISEEEEKDAKLDFKKIEKRINEINN